MCKIFHAVLVIQGAALEPPMYEVVVIRPLDKVGLDDLLISVHEDVIEAIDAMYAYQATIERGMHVRNSNPEVAVALDTKEVSHQHTRNISVSNGPERRIRLTA